MRGRDPPSRCRRPTRCRSRRTSAMTGARHARLVEHARRRRLELVEGLRRRVVDRRWRANGAARATTARGGPRIERSYRRRSVRIASAILACVTPQPPVPSPSRVHRYTPSVHGVLRRPQESALVRRRRRRHRLVSQLPRLVRRRRRGAVHRGARSTAGSALLDERAASACHASRRTSVTRRRCASARCCASASTSRLENPRRLRHRFEMARDEDGQRVATGFVRVGCVTLADFSPRDFPDDVAAVRRSDPGTGRGPDGGPRRGALDVKPPARTRAPSRRKAGTAGTTTRRSTTGRTPARSADAMCRSGCG